MSCTLSSKTPPNFHFVTIHPKFIESYLDFGVLKKAMDLKLINIKVHNLRDYAIDERGSIDAKPYGGGTGMVMRPEPLAKVCETIYKLTPQQRPITISTRPGGIIWQQKYAEQFIINPSDVIFICGRFEGMDQRFIDQ